MAEEDGLSVDEVCDGLIVELATLEEGDGNALAQTQWVWGGSRCGFRGRCGGNKKDIEALRKEVARKAAELATQRAQ